MTIAFQGHVERIESGPLGHTAITLEGDARWMNCKPLQLLVPIDIAKAYWPGMPVQFTIYPLALTRPPSAQKENDNG